MSVSNLLAGVMGAIVVIAVVALVVAAARRGPARTEVPPEPRSSQVADRDATLQNELTRLNVRKDEPHSTDFFFYLPDEESAKAVGAELERTGLTVKISRSKGKPPWCCEANKMTPVDAVTIAGLREKFEALARVYGGQYDGWGCGLNEGEGK